MDATLQKTVNVIAQLTPGASGHTKSFQQLVRAIGEAKTKHEEERIMKREAVTLKEKLSARDVTVRQMREYLIRLIYCEMLGIECSWGYIFAVKFTQSTNIVDKRIGYLASSLVLHQDHELNMLLINSIQRDLRSSNMLEISMALIIISRLVGNEMIPALLPLVREKTHHPKELVRKKAILALHHFYRCSPSSVSHLMDDFRCALSDPDPGVMEAALILLLDIVKDNPNQHKDLSSAFLNILSQVVNRRLPSQFEYHSVPAPWIQIRLLRILALLGADDAKKSEEMCNVIDNTLASAECNSNIGQAITYECIRTITSIYLHPLLIQKAGNAITRFLVASNNNWKYLGVNALGALVQIEPKYALDHQMVVIDCLDDPDETLKRKTLDLLYRMTNPSNLTIITEKMIAYLRKTNDEFIKVDLVAKITELAEKFSPDNQWFIECMNSVFELGGDFVRREVAHNLMRIIAEGTGNDLIDKELQKNAVMAYIDLLKKPHLPDILIKLICWVVGEYAYELGEDCQIEDLLEKITGLLNLNFTNSGTYSWIFNSITRLIALIGYFPENVHSQVALHFASENIDIQQRCSELLQFSGNLQVMQKVLPLDSSCEDLNIDPSLSFLDSFVSQSLVKGAPPYKPPHLRLTEHVSGPKVQQHTEIKFQPYALPLRSTSSLTSKEPLEPHLEYDSPDTLHLASNLDSSLSSPSEKPISIPQPKGERKWTKDGYLKALGMESDNVDTSILMPNILISNEKNNSEHDSGTEASLIEAMPLPSHEQQKRKNLASALFTGLSEPTKKHITTTRVYADNSLSTKQNVSSARVQHNIDVEKSKNEDLLLDLEDNVSYTPTPLNNEQYSLSSVDDILTSSMLDQNLTKRDSTDEFSNPLLPLPAVPSTSLDDSRISFSNENIPLELSNTPIAYGWNKKDLVSDVQLRLSVTKFLEPKSLIISFLMNNQKHFTSPVSLILKPSSNLEACIWNTTLKDINWVGNLDGFSNYNHMLMLFPKSVALNMNIAGEVIYEDDAKTPKRLFFDIQFDTSDFIRPLQMKTVQFGQKWNNLPNEKKIKFASSVKDPQDFTNTMTTRSNFHSVQIIGLESIVSGKFLPETICLIHCKLSPSLELWIRSTNKLLTEMLSKELQAMLK